VATVTRVFPPPAGGPAVDTSKWTVEYEADFTSESHNFVSGGATKSIGGVTWTAVNRTSLDADVFDLDTSGTGLRINAKGAPNNTGRWFSSFQNQPYLWATLDDMMSSLAIDDTLCLQLEMTTTADTLSQWQRYGLGLWKNDAPGGQNNFVVVSRFFQGSYACNASIRNTQQDNGASGVAQPNFFEIVSYPGGSQALSCGTVGSSFPDPLDTTTYRAYNAMNQVGPGSSGGSLGIPSFNIPFDKAAFVITCQVQGSSTALNSTAKRMRVLRRKKA
jgi:hypothetical protein